MDQFAAIQNKLAIGERLCAVINVGWVQDWVRCDRLLSLVEKHGEYGLLIINYQLSENNAGIVKIEKAIPVNESFKLLIGDVYLKISYDVSNLIFELCAGAKTDNFLVELRKACDASDKTPDHRPTSEFQWLKKYSTMANQFKPDSLSQTAVDMFDPLCGNNSSQEFVKIGFEDNFVIGTTPTVPRSDVVEPHKRFNEDVSQDSLNSIPRESIAVGETHLAARESIVWLQMNTRRKEYTHNKNFRIFVGTWNVNGKPPTVSLANWLACDAEPPDIYAVGFQELDLSKEAFVFTDSPREMEWLTAVKNALHPEAEYKLIKLVRLVGMMLIIFTQSKHDGNIQNVAAETVGTGLMGKLGNKGGVAVRFEFHNTTMCFVNSHLAAHPEEYERRNQDYADICSRMAFHLKQFEGPKPIKDHDQIYWLGDLNYRINDLKAFEVKELLSDNQYSRIFECDQLKIQQSSKKAFQDYEEGMIEFHPTYKYNLMSDDWDMGRCPAWCDRILWKGINIKQKLYRSHRSLQISDHKPVSAIFESGVMIIDIPKYRQVYEEVMKQLDKLENEFLPQVTVDNSDIDFGIVKFVEPLTRYLTIANTGQVPVRFEFIKKPNEASYCKEWLTIKPYCSYIMPGDKCDVELEVYVDKRTAYRLNKQQDTINDILVLHLEGGKDFFITIHGNYQLTSFGISLQTLVYIRQPICEISSTDLAKLDSDSTVIPSDCVDGEPYDVPKEIWLLVDHLSRQAMDQHQLFEQPGLQKEIWQIRDCLDNSMPTSIPGSNNSIAEALLLFLEALPEPVIPYKFYQKSLDASQNFTLCQQVVRSLPPVHQNVFKYLMAFVKALLFHAESNKLDAKSLSSLFGGILLRPLEPELNTKKISQTNERKRANFIYHFLNNDSL